MNTTILIHDQLCEVTGTIEMSAVPAFLQKDFQRIVFFKDASGQSGAFFVARSNAQFKSFVTYVKPDARSSFFKATK